MVAVSAFAQVDPNRTVLVINGEEIKGAEYYRRMEYLTGVGRWMGTSFAEFPPGFLTIEQLITERLVLQLARERNVMPTDTEVQSELNFGLEADPKMLENWTASGRSRDELLYQIRLQLAQFKLATQGITITDQEVDQFYKENQAMFTTPRRYKLRVIAVTDDAKQQRVDADLRSGKKFDEVARAHSDDLSASAGGEFGTVALSDLNETARRAIQNAKIGQPTDWVISSDTRVKFLVEQILPEEVQKMDNRLRREVRRMMMMDRGRVKNNVPQAMNEMRSKANIDIKHKEFAEAYQKFIDAFLKEKGIGQ
jgi:parvulin-like peptidyl-prolyl isomerase